MDEFAIQKGHRYATVIVDPTVKRVLWVGRGRAREDIRPFFELLGEDGCKRVKAVVMDMNAAYEKEVRALLGLPRHLRPVSLIPVGYPAESPEAPERAPREEVATFCR